MLVGVGIYLFYDTLHDHAAGVSADAFRHAQQIVDAEKFLGLYHEYSIQQAFLGSALVHVVLEHLVRHHPLRHARRALVWMYRKLPARYVRWRNTLVLMLGVSLLVFWAYPLMPPRLMPARYEFVDTAADFFNFGPQVRVHLGANGQPTAAAVRTYGNLFAAMPSLHVGWSTWSALAGVAAAPPHVGEGAVGPLPRHHLLLHRGDGQPLDPRRGRRLGRARHRLRRRPGGRVAAQPPPSTSRAPGHVISATA